MLHIIEKEHSHMNIFKCKVCPIDEPDNITEDVELKKEEVELIEFLNKLQRQLRMHDDTMNELWNKVEAFGAMKHDEGALS